MLTARIVIENRTSKPMQFHIEPECSPFEVPPGKSAEISGSYETHPITIQFSDDDEYGLFGSVFPGDGDIVITTEGRDVTEY